MIDVKALLAADFILTKIFDRCSKLSLLYPVKVFKNHKHFFSVNDPIKSMFYNLNFV